MAELLRHGARRIGGSVLQRTQAAFTSPAVAEERRRLVPRRMYSTQEAHGGIEREIQQKKDELYDLIMKAEKNARTSTWCNTRLLLHLYEEVTPRPYDPDWCDMQVVKRVIRRFKTVRVYLLTFGILEGIIVYERYSEDKKVHNSGHDDGRSGDTISPDGELVLSQEQ